MDPDYSGINPEIGRTLSAGGYAINYHDRGQGSPVLLIHGSGPGVSAWANWRNTIPALCDRFRVIAPDMLGFGYSDRSTNGYHMDLWVEQLRGVLDALEIEQTALV
ncbi:MAG TPA: alpha/beta fold hydrolase, partial [Burkholderiaceae bacterium]|nr:alpha/beta fold hydrolase [Burkholderiaceae bacterium]